MIIAGTSTPAGPIGAPTTITQDWQIDFDGLILGAGTSYGVTKWGGFLDMPTVRSQNNARPSRHGIYHSADYSGEKIYDVELDVTAENGVAFADAVAALAAGTYSQDSLRPLRFRLPNLGVRSTLVQCRKRVVPVEIAYQFGLSQMSALQFYAPDARQFGPAVSLPTGLRSGGTGLTYPIVYPLSYGVPALGGRVSFVNTGTAHTEPVLTVTGPFGSGFDITYVETGQHLRYTAPVGTDLVLDCAEGTVTTQGQERGPFLTVRDWFSVAAGASATFSIASLGGESAASAPTAGMTVAIAPAYL